MPKSMHTNYLTNMFVYIILCAVGIDAKTHSMIRMHVARPTLDVIVSIVTWRKDHNIAPKQLHGWFQCPLLVHDKESCHTMTQLLAFCEKEHAQEKLGKYFDFTFTYIQERHGLCRIYLWRVYLPKTLYYQEDINRHMALETKLTF